MSGQIFVGRDDELKRWDKILREPRGQAAVVIGPPGMGKTTLLDNIMEITAAHPDLACGALRYEVTATDSPDAVMELMMDHAFEAAQAKPGSFDLTPERRAQWDALFSLSKLVPGGEQIKDLIASRKRDPAKNARDQFLARLRMVSASIPANGRAVFIIDPEKYMADGSADAWRLVVRDLPDKIKVIFAQRPEDAIAESHPNGEFWRMKDRVALLTGDEQLEPLGAESVEEFADAAEGTGLSDAELRGVLARYDGHPFALDAAVRLLQNGTSADELPDHPEPTEFADLQWTTVQKKQGVNAIRLIEALAVLEVAAPREIVRATAGLEEAEVKAVLGSAFMRSLVRFESDRMRLYHALFLEQVRSELDRDVEHVKTYHRRAVQVLNDRINHSAPDLFAARSICRHVTAVEGPILAVDCLVKRAAPILNRGSDYRSLYAVCDELRSAIKAPNSQAVVSSATTSDTRSGSNRPTAMESLAGALADLDALQGIALKNQRRFEDARVAIERALAVYQSQHDSLNSATAIGNLAGIETELDDLISAEALLLSSVELLRASSAPEEAAVPLLNLGQVYVDQGEPSKAEIVLREAQTISKRFSDQEGLAGSLLGLGRLRLSQNDLFAARTFFLEALAINETHGLFENEANARMNLGLIALRNHETESAHHHLTLAMQFYGDRKLHYQFGQCAEMLGMVFLQGRQPAMAREAWMYAKEVFEYIGETKQLDVVSGLIDEFDEFSSRVPSQAPS